MDPAPERPSQRTSAASQRGAAGNSGRSQRSSGTSGRSGGGDKKIFFIIGGVIGLLVTVVLVLYFVRTGEKQTHDQKKQEKLAIQEKNIDLGKEYFKKAYAAGYPWISGKKEGTEDEIMAPFKGDDTVYNVVFERTIKEKKDEKKVQYKKDASRLTYVKIESPVLKHFEDEKYTIYRGKTNDQETDLVIAEKYIPGEGASFTGGQVIIVLKAITK
jgi:uncharacterized protein YpmB